jgi:flagellar hook-associated protein FlgK
MRAQSAIDAAQRDRALADALEFRAAAVSGVNLDEEMARMVEQQAYSVAARIISVTDELFDELLGIAN